MDLKKLSKIADSARVEEGKNIVFGAPGGGFPSFGDAKKFVDEETYNSMKDEYYEKFHQKACEYYDGEVEDVDFMYSEVMAESCGFLATADPDPQLLVEWEITRETNNGKIYAGLIGV